MACELTKGRQLDCRDIMGGVKNIYFAQHEDATVTASAGEVTDLDKENDKNTVISLREIAQEKIPLNYLNLWPQDFLQIHHLYL